MFRVMAKNERRIVPSTTIRVSKTTRVRLHKLAEIEGRHMSQQLAYMVKKGLVERGFDLRTLEPKSPTNWPPPIKRRKRRRSRITPAAPAPGIEVF
jgi:hypothetical protein